MKQRLHIMRPRLFIAVAGLSLILAYPVSKALANRDKIIESQQRLNNSLQLKIKKLQEKPKPALTVIPAKPVQPVTVSAPVVPTTTHVAIASYKCRAYAAEFQKYGWNPNTAMAICQAESSGNPNPPANGYLNYDGVSDYGLMQLHGIAILDPAANIAYAYYHKYLTQGWSAWSTYTNGKYYQYL